MVDSLSEKRLGPSVAIALAPSKPRGQLEKFVECKTKSGAQTSSIALLLPFFSSENNRSRILIVLRGYSVLLIHVLLSPKVPAGTPDTELYGSRRSARDSLIAQHHGRFC
jgi:hypothetical protein